MNQPQPRHQRPTGCATAFVIGMTLSLLTVLGAIGGGISYLVAYLAGAPSIASCIGGGVTAWIIVCLASPAGAGMMWFFLPYEGGTVTRSFLSLLMAFAGPIYNGGAVFILATLSAIAGAFLFQWCPPLWAAILVATVFPIVGLVTGAVAGSPLAPLVDSDSD